MLTGFATLSQTAAAVVEAARRAGKAVGVAKVIGKGAGNVVPWNGGLSLHIGIPQLVEVDVVGTGTMTIQVSGSPYAARNGWLKLPLRQCASTFGPL